MEIAYTTTLAFLEMTFVLVSLLLLHALRKIIGIAAFYIAVGLLLVFTQVVSSAELKVVMGAPGADFYIAPTVLFLPYLTALMIVYITEGTLAAQRLIVGAMAVFGFYIYIVHLTITQAQWPGVSISQGPAADSLEYLLHQSQLTMAGTVLAQSLDLFLIPIFYQRLRNMKCRIFISVLGSLMLTQIVDTFVYVSACYWGTPQWWLYINSSYIAKSFATVWLSVLASVYLTRIEREMPGEGRRALDIVLAFFGGYGKALALQENLREWEGRYKMVVENASDMILLLSREGKILDGNFAAVRIFKLRSRNELLGGMFSDMIVDMDDRPVRWSDYAKSFKIEDTSDGPHIHRLACHAVFSSEKVDLDIAMSAIEVAKTPMFIVLGRDVTEQNRLAHEKEELIIKLAHKQRLESVGELAGGIAHDFNNFIHAIQGHLDVIGLGQGQPDPDTERHLKKIDDITEQAATLTRQLLGYARKGKYFPRIIDLRDLAGKSADLFLPGTKQDVELKLEIPDKEFLITGDQVQLQQVIMNLFLNALDAVEGNSSEKGKTITLRVGNAEDFRRAWFPPDEFSSAVPFEYNCLVVRDNGSGIEKDTLKKIFEPFFTTKPHGKGTGMGLAMAYGIISNHKGWFYVDSARGEGSAFHIFLPAARPEPRAETL
jgi:signal transduction histidine kinase